MVLLQAGSPLQLLRRLLLLILPLVELAGRWLLQL